MRSPLIALIAHSWGSMPAALFVTQHPELVDRLVLFGPILRRDGPAEAETTAWGLVANDQQHARFIRDVPKDHAQVLEEADFPAWAAAYLASDPTAAGRARPAVKVPSGPSADVLTAHAGVLPYDPALADAQRFAAELPAGAERRVVTIPEATHLMHLETGRHALYAATRAFLKGE